MFVLAAGSAFLALLIPLAAWALITLSRWHGLVLGAALLACAAGWLGLMAGWVPPGLVADGVLALVVVAPALIMAGRLADRVAVIRRGPPAEVQAAGVQPAGVQPAEVRLRLVTAHSLSAVCVCLNVGVLGGLAVAVLYLNLNLQYTPPSSDVLPLPAPLTVASDRDLGCSSGPGGPYTRCEREIDVTGPARLSAGQTMRIINDALARRHGWRLGRPQNGCRDEGWLLGREDVCVDVESGQGGVQVTLESGP
jgi:hypothetical protein